MQDKEMMILELSNVRVQAIASSNFEYMQKMQNAFHKNVCFPANTLDKLCTSLDQISFS